MNELITQFHFLRPQWLLAIVPVVLLAVYLMQQERNSVTWRQVIAPELLKYLLDSTMTKRTRWQLFALFFAWLLTCVALAGPTWQSIPQPVRKNEAAVVIVWDLSPSVVAEDLVPSRVVRARHKLTDFLNARAEGLTALVAYAGEAHVVSPLTDDNETIINLLPALHPNMMPLAGSNVEMGVDTAIKLFTDSGIPQGDIIVVTDEITPNAQDTLRETLTNSRFRLTIFGIGTAQGAPIPTGGGGFAKDQYGSIVIAKLNTVELRNLADDVQGYYVAIQADDSDIRYLLNVTQQAFPQEEQMRLLEKEFDTWLDAGQFIPLLILPFLLLAFRRGWILPVALLIVILPQRSEAFEWQDLWLTPDQQAQREFDRGAHDQAANKFELPEWKGAARYRDADFANAIASFDNAIDAAADDQQKVEALYNKGNALAKAGKYENALNTYEEALAINETHEDANFNAELIRQLLEQQSENQQANNQSGESSDQQNQSENSQEQQGQGEQQQADNNSSQNSDDNGEQQSDSSESQQNQQAQNQQDGQQDSQQDSQQGNEEEPINEDAARELADQQQGEERQDLQQFAQSQTEENSEDGEQGQTPMLSRLDESEQQGDEQQQAMEQWLRQIPDDPSGLLRRKFEYQHRQLRRRYQNGEWELPNNGANQRW